MIPLSMEVVFPSASSSARGLADALLCLDPVRRPSAAAALGLPFFREEWTCLEPRALRPTALAGEGPPSFFVPTRGSNGPKSSRLLQPELLEDFSHVRALASA
mmetsp:Transcript_61619/g.139482  ORF Transcript_61619/g.139482 Transcript_61619/m.139482 type:complete len:103 (-) Transcript_61619:410-718(-)